MYKNVHFYITSLCTRWKIKILCYALKTHPNKVKLTLKEMRESMIPQSIIGPQILNGDDK